MDTKIYVFFALSAINFILFLNMNKGKIKTIKYRLCIFYFYFMGLVCGDMIYSIKSGDLPQYLSLAIFVIVMVIANVIFIGMKE